MANEASKEDYDRKPDERRSVLAELPHTRPQRASRRRKDARAQARTASEAASSDAGKSAPANASQSVPSTARKPTPSNARKPTPSNAPKSAISNARKSTSPNARKPLPSRSPKAAAPKTAPRSDRPASDAAAGALQEYLPTPRQGYEADELVGTSVTPPTGTELVGALAELAGELAQAGVSAGGRLLRGALSRLSGS